MAEMLAPKALTITLPANSNASEPKVGVESIWNVATAYSAGTRNIISTVTHRRYRALQASTGKDPTDLANIDFWVDDGPTNAYAMFDHNTSQATTVTSPLNITLTPGFFSGFCLFGLNADQMTVTVKDAPGGNVLFTEVVSLEGSATSSRWDWYFSPFQPVTDYIKSGLQPYSTMELTLSITGSGTVSVGVLGVGDVLTIGGSPLVGAEATPKSKSYIKTNIDGSQTLVLLSSGVDMNISCVVKKEDFNRVHALLLDNMAKPAMWIGTQLSEFNCLRTWGVGEVTENIVSNNHGVFKINVKGILK